MFFFLQRKERGPGLEKIMIQLNRMAMSLDHKDVSLLNVSFVSVRRDEREECGSRPGFRSCFSFTVALVIVLSGCY